jgi:predicted MFS family arabinose efflux permease
MLAISTGLIGGGMLVPLGPVFAERVLGGGPSTFFMLLTALGFGVATGVLALTAVQKKLPRITIFTGSVLGAGGSLFLAASVTSLNRAWPLVFLLGICAGAVYVLGFTILHESVEDELRGRVFSALYTVVRLSLLLSFALGGFLSQLLNGLARNLVGDDLTVGNSVTVYLPGVRLALWLAGLIIIGAGILAVRSLRESRP